MSFPRYGSYKDSGVEWLGELPIHWEVKRLRYLGEAIIGLTYDPADVTDQNDEHGVLRAGPACLNRLSASISGASAGIRPPRGAAEG